jgi:hypothetical protein
MLAFFGEAAAGIQRKARARVSGWQDTGNKSRHDRGFDLSES